MSERKAKIRRTGQNPSKRRKMIFVRFLCLGHEDVTAIHCCLPTDDLDLQYLFNLSSTEPSVWSVAVWMKVLSVSHQKLCVELCQTTMAFYAFNNLAYDQWAVQFDIKIYKSPISTWCLKILLISINNDAKLICGCKNAIPLFNITIWYLVIVDWILIPIEFEHFKRHCYPALICVKNHNPSSQLEHWMWYARMLKQKHALLHALYSVLCKSNVLR